MKAQLNKRLALMSAAFLAAVPIAPSLAQRSSSSSVAATMPVPVSPIGSISNPVTQQLLFPDVFYPGLRLTGQRNASAPVGTAFVSAPEIPMSSINITNGSRDAKGTLSSAATIQNKDVVLGSIAVTAMLAVLGAAAFIERKDSYNNYKRRAENEQLRPVKPKHQTGQRLDIG